MKKILLIGQGIAGTLLASSLCKKGVQVYIAEGDLAGASSPAAAGIINPVTGKRFVKSWRFDEFYPVAKLAYQQLEQDLGISIWEERPTLRLLATAEEANDWAIRCSQPEYQDHLGEAPDAGAWAPFLKPGFGFGVIRKSARANLPVLIQTFRKKTQNEGFFINQTIDYQEIASLTKTYDQIVFCEGWRAEQNPFFPKAAFRVSKGEALIIRFKEAPTDKSGKPFSPEEMLKKTLLLVPLGDDTYWVGSTYRWHFDDTLPDMESRAYMLGYLHEMFDAPFEIVDQLAGIRPTMVDRRPVVERSEINPNLFIFNGLGTKGALLAPYFAEQLANDLLLEGKHSEKV